MFTNRILIGLLMALPTFFVALAFYEAWLISKFSVLDDEHHPDPTSK